MNAFELFTMIYFVFDSIYDDLPEDKKNLPEDKWQDDIGMYAGDLNPFAWEECTSADPAYFLEFYDFVKDKSIGDDYGYSLVCDYLEKEDFYHNVKDIFMTYNKNDWINACKDYLSTEHKGSDWSPEQIQKY